MDYEAAIKAGLTRLMVGDEAAIRAGIEGRLAQLREARDRAAQEAAALRARADQVTMAGLRLEGGIAELEALLAGFGPDGPAPNDAPAHPSEPVINGGIG